MQSTRRPAAAAVAGEGEGADGADGEEGKDTGGGTDGDVRGAEDDDEEEEEDEEASDSDGEGDDGDDARAPSERAGPAASEPFSSAGLSGRGSVGASGRGTGDREGEGEEEVGGLVAELRDMDQTISAMNSLTNTDEVPYAWQCTCIFFRHGNGCAVNDIKIPCISWQVIA
jgi:hypothetical protein